MRFNFSRNPIGRLSCWIHNEVIEPFSRWYFFNTKAHYECTVCGRIEAPYFVEEPYASLPYDYGWHQLKNSKRWICHHCADHDFIPTKEWDGIHGWTWDAWQEYIHDHNKVILDIIKEKDPEYYHYWFEGGREEELFGGYEDE